MRTSFTALLFVIALTAGFAVSPADAQTPPQLVSPPNDTTIAQGTNTVVFRWNKATGGSPIQYMVELSTATNFAHPFPFPPTTDTFYRPPQIPLPPGEGYWRVHATINGAAVYSTPAYFHFTIGTAVQRKPAVFFNIPETQQTLYCTTANGPFTFIIGAYHPSGIKSVFALVELHRDTFLLVSQTFTLLPITDVPDRQGAYYAQRWSPTLNLLPRDTIKYKFFVRDSNDQLSTLDTVNFRILIKGPLDSASYKYPRPLALGNQFVYELTDTAGHENDSTRKRLRPDSVAKGIVHRYNTFCAPTVGAAFADNGIDTNIVEAVAGAFHTNVPTDGTMPADLANGGLLLAAGTRKIEMWLDTVNVLRARGLDTAITMHRASPHFSDLVRALKDTDIIFIGIGYWSDSGGVRWKRRGAHLLAGKSFRADPHWVGVSAINETMRTVTMMDPECGCMRPMRWGLDGPLTNAIDSAYYPDVVSGMTPLVECMISFKRVYKPQTGVKDLSTIPDDAVLLSAYPNPFTSTTSITTRGIKTQGATLTVTDMLGRVVGYTPIDHADAFTLDGRDLPPGIYICTLRAGARSWMERIVLAK